MNTCHLYKFSLLFVISIVLFPAVSFAQAVQADCDPPALIPIKAGSKWGYCDRYMKMQIPAQFDSAAPFQEAEYNKPMNSGSNNYATVKKNGYCYRMDDKGKLVTKAMNCNEIHELRIDMLSWSKVSLYKEGDLYGIRLNEEDSIIIQPLYDSIDPFDDSKIKNTYYKVKKEGKYGVVADDGRVVVPLIYDDITRTDYFVFFRINLVGARLDNEQFFIDFCGRQYKK